MKSAFSEALSNLRLEKGLSQRQAAADLGVSQALLSHYENSAREPKLDFVVRACNYYDVSADYILGRTSSRKDESAMLMDSANEVLKAMEELNQAQSGLVVKLRERFG